MIEHVPAIVDLRRNLVMMEAEFPPEAQSAFNNIENNFTPWAFSVEERADWAGPEDTADRERHAPGTRIWRVDLPAGGTVALDGGYEIRIPAGKALTGGNRRS